MKAEAEPSGMSEGRALLTEREREALAGEETGSYRYKTRTYLRNRLEKLERDAELLAEHEPELFDRLQAAVCDDAVDAADADDSSAEDAQDAGVTPDAGAEAVTPDRTREAESAAESDIVGAVEDALNALDASEARRAAVRGCIDYLREHGTGQKSDFVDAVYPDHPGGYQSEGGWWNTIGKEHLKAVAEDLNELTPPPAEGSHTWEWRIGEADP
jgi:hypothetical protein